MLKCTNLVKMYGDFRAVDHLTFQVNQGEVFGLIGANGAGKTTTIKLILGLSQVTSGEIRIEPEVRIGYSPETPYFPGFLTALEVLNYYGHLQNLDQPQKEAETILKRVGLEDTQKKKVSQFSKGMIQRLALGQSLLGSPDLLLLDEPAAGLDAAGRVEILELISSLKKEGKTIILNSHILHDVERVADRGLILQRGQKVKEWDFNQELLTLQLECSYDSDLYSALESFTVHLVEKELGRLEIQLKDREQIPIIVRMITLAGGKIYSVQPGRNLEEIFLQTLGGSEI